MAKLFEDDLAYSSIGVCRSALSAYHDPIDGFKLGEHPKVSALLAGIYNKRPPQPRYTFIWDVDTLLRYLKSLPENQSLSDRLLTFKLTSLLALTSAGRASEIKFLDISYMASSETAITFTLSHLSKTCKKGSLPSIVFTKFASEPKLCVVTTLESYILRSKIWRTDCKNQLLLSYVKPHNPVEKCTIAGWLKNTLNLAGINTDVFKAHSTRAASTSKVGSSLGSSGLSLQDILKRGNWSNADTWQKFYNKEIVGNHFEHSVLGLL